MEQFRREIRERKDKRNIYVRNWRESQRIQKRKNIFMEEYVRVKFTEVYSEALNFYSTLDQIYPQKKDLCRTQEFRSWRAALNHGNKNNKKKSTAVTRQAVQQPTDNMMLKIPLLPRLLTTPLQASVEPTVEIQSPTPPEMPVEIQSQQLATPPEMPVEIQPQQLATPPEMPVEIQPQQLATSPEIAAEITVEMPPFQFETPAENDEGITDQRIREIIQELQNDPDLNGIFDDIQPTVQNDEGIEIPTIEEEREVDLALIDHDRDFYAWPQFGS